jgi:hypothetical protein
MTLTGCPAARWNGTVEAEETYVDGRYDEANLTQSPAPHAPLNPR